MEALLALHFPDDRRRALSFEVSVYSMIGEIVHGVSGCKVIGSDAHYQAALLLVGCRQTNNIRGGIVGLFGRFLFPVIIAEVSDD